MNNHDEYQRGFKAGYRLITQKAPPAPPPPTPLLQGQNPFRLGHSHGLRAGDGDMGRRAPVVRVSQ